MTLPRQGSPPLSNVCRTDGDTTCASSSQVTLQLPNTFSPLSFPCSRSKMMQGKLHAALQQWCTQPHAPFLTSSVISSILQLNSTPMPCSSLIKAAKHHKEKKHCQADMRAVESASQALQPGASLPIPLPQDASHPLGPICKTRKPWQITM